MLVEDFGKPVHVSAASGEDVTTLTNGDHIVRIRHDLHEVTLSDASGHMRLRMGGEEANGFLKWASHPLGFVRPVGGDAAGVVTECFSLKPDEGLYGFGEHFMGLNKNGRTVDMNQEDACGTMTPRMYKCVPFYMSTRGYGVFVNQTARMTFWAGTRTTASVQLAVEDDYLDCFVVLGEDMKQILARYTALTGKSPVPPKWSFGLWMSKITYQSEGEVMRVARNLRERKLPADVIHLDTGWFEKDWVCDLEFSRERFPDPKRMFDTLRSMGFRVSLWQQPYIRKTSKLFKECMDGDHFIRNDMGCITPRPWSNGVLDYTRPQTVNWHTDRFRRLFALGAAAIKTDFGEAAPDDGIYHDGTPAHRMHNLYPLLYNKALFEVTKECTGDSIVWGRSATAGSQRYPLYWGGDNTANFDNIEPSLCGGLSLGMCGFSFWSQDIGGFRGNPTPELFIRWMQVGLFGSHARIHGYNDREPYRFGPEAETVSRDFLNLRVRLMPYLYSVAHASAAAGLPVMRPLVLEFENDRNVRDLSSQFMLGPSLLVAPILEEGARERDIYLPEGTWYEWWSGQCVAGNRWIRAEIPLDRTGLYVRQGSLIPLGPVCQSVDKQPWDELDVRVYPDGNDLHFELADGGSCPITWDHENGTLYSPEGAPKLKAIIVGQDRNIPGKGDDNG